MKPIILLVIYFISFYISLKAQNNNGNDVKIIPQPVKIINKPGIFIIDSLTQIINTGNYSDRNNINNCLTEKIKTATGYNLSINDSQSAVNRIILNVDSSLKYNPEGYFLNVTAQTITIRAKTDNGLFYGIQTLFQLLPEQIESDSLIKHKSWKIPCLEINDYPRFRYRGMLLDVCRHFLSIGFIKKQLDIMALYKLNTFHWHLTDDQGWRIEIRKYPKLTEFGSKRTEADGSIYAGFYTREQIKDVINYAKARYINILPEIEMPGHSMAALASYPEYSCIGGPFQVPCIWGSQKEAFCPGKEQTFSFINDIIDEVSQLFPYEYIHIGGDECLKDRWKECPFCQTRMKNEGLKSVKQLQSYFVKRVEKIVNAHGKKIIGWDEILEGGIAPGATIMSWENEKGGITAAGHNHEVIMCPQKWLYLDHYQGSEKVEPVALKGLVTLKDVYSYNPVPAKIQPNYQNYIIGAQANIWSEYLYTPDKVEYIAYPRLLAFAEVSWTIKKNKDFGNFIYRLNNQYPRLDYHHVNYHIPLPEGPANTEVFFDTLNLNFTSSRPVKMTYTLDGTEPGISSSRYEKPIHLNESTTVKIRTVLETGEMGQVRIVKAIKQAFKPGIINDTKPGLILRNTLGMYNTVNDLDTASKWSESLIYDLKTKFNYLIPSADIITGYIEIQLSGIYYFSTNVEQFWLNGNLLIDNSGEVKNHSRNDASVALLKGKHEIKIIFLNNIVGGRPASINGIRLFYRRKHDNEYKLVDGLMLSH